MKKIMKKALVFTAVLVPIAILAGIFTGVYSFETYASEMQQLIVEQIGSYELFVVIVTIQSVYYAVVCGFLGYIIAEKTGLLRTFGFEKNKLIKATLLGAILGAVFSLDYWVFGKFIPEVAQVYETGITVNNLISSVLYGGIIEEIMLRFFVMSLLVLILWKLFYRKRTKEQIPEKVFIIANVIAAILFAALHLPATFITFAHVDALVIFRCFLFNGGLGIGFGWLYRKYGIQYAMLGHMGCHIISKIIWLLFV